MSDLIDMTPSLSDQAGFQAGAGNNYSRTDWMTWPIQPRHDPPLKSPGLVTKFCLGF